MPYIIAVLALAVVGVGFALSHNQTDIAVTQNTEATVAATEETIPSLVSIDDELTEAPETPIETEVVIETENTATVVAKTEITSTQTTPQTNTIEPNTATTPSTPAPAAPTPSTPAITYTYANGTYNAIRSYRTPDGNYSMDVSLTVSNDTVTAVDISFSGKAARDSYTKRFLKSYEGGVVGKDLENVDLARVGGASLTTNAFNVAIDSIRAQAIL